VVFHPLRRFRFRRIRSSSAEKIVMLSLNETLERLYRAHAGELRAFARRRVGPHEAEDIVQEAYVRALQEGRVASISYQKAYLFHVAANLTIDTVRKAQVRSRHASDTAVGPSSAEPAQEPESSIESYVELRQLCAHLEDLSPTCREAFLLYWVEDLDQSETARRLGVTVRTVNRHLTRAVEHLHSRVSR
jgi:RNA polymerase sigma factor (sigma-70 family)